MQTSRTITLAIALAAFAGPALAAAPFSRSAADFVRDEIHVGINIGNTFDVPSGNEIDCGATRRSRAS